MLQFAISPIMGAISRQFGKAVLTSALVKSVADLQRALDDVSLNSPEFLDSFALDNSKSSVSEARATAVADAIIPETAYVHAKTPEEIAPLRVERPASPTLADSTSLMAILENRNIIEGAKLEELKEQTDALRASVQVGVTLSQQLDVLGLLIKQLTSVLTVTMPEIASSTTKQAEGIRKQAEHIIATKTSQSTVNVSPAVNVSATAPIVNVSSSPATVNVDFSTLSTSLQDVATSLQSVALNHEEQYEVSQLMRQEELLTYEDGTPVLDGQGNQISMSAIKIQTIANTALARAKRKEEAMHDFMVSEQVVSNLDGRPITKDDGTEIAITPRQASLIKDVAVAKNQADEAEFELSNEDIDGLTPDFVIPDFYKHEDDYQKNESIQKIQDYLAREGVY